MRLFILLLLSINLTAFSGTCDESGDAAISLQSGSIPTLQAESQKNWLKGDYQKSITSLQTICSQVDEAADNVAGCFDYELLYSQLTSFSGSLHHCWIPFYGTLSSFYNAINDSQDDEENSIAVEAALAKIKDISDKTNCMKVDRGDSYIQSVQANYQKIGFLKESFGSCAKDVVAFDQKNNQLALAYQNQDRALAGRTLNELIFVTGKISRGDNCHQTLRQLAGQARQTFVQQKLQLDRQSN